jgi:hypothetical protein
LGTGAEGGKQQAAGEQRAKAAGVLHRTPRLAK